MCLDPMLLSCQMLLSNFFGRARQLGIRDYTATSVEHLEGEFEVGYGCRNAASTGRVCKRAIGSVSLFVAKAVV